MIGVADQTASIPQQVIEDAARALSFTPWRNAPDDLKSIIRRQAERVLSAALSGRQVVEPPAPDDTDNEGDPLWDLGGNMAVIAYCDADGHPMVRMPDGEDEDPEWVELYATVLLAATRESRRLAAEFADTAPAGGEARG